MLIGGCSSGGDRREIKTFAECGMPTPQARLDASAVPAEFVPSEAELARAERERGGFLAAINTRMSVNEAFERYRDVLEGAGYTLTGHDNEGFEAELFFKRGSKVGAIQIRMSRCDDASLVFVQIVDRKFLG